MTVAVWYEYTLREVVSIPRLSHGMSMSGDYCVRKNKTEFKLGVQGLAKDGQMGPSYM